MMYFVEKVRLKQIASKTDLIYPKHKLIGHFFNLEDTIKSVKDSAKEYMTRKNLKFTDQTDIDPTTHESIKNNTRPKKIVRYTMRSNHANKNVIDIYREEENYKEGWVSASIKRTEEKIAYFVYTTYDKTFSDDTPKDYSIMIPAPPAPPNQTNITTRVKGRLNNMGKELEMIENHGKLVDELRQTCKYRNNDNSLSANEIIDEELKHLEELRKFVH